MPSAAKRSQNLARKNNPGISWWKRSPAHNLRKEGEECVLFELAADSGFLNLEIAGVSVSV